MIGEVVLRIPSIVAIMLTPVRTGSGLKPSQFLPPAGALPSGPIEIN